MTAIEVSPDIDRRLNELVRESGRTKVDLVRRALLEFLDEPELCEETERRLQVIEAGRAETESLDSLMNEYGLER